MSKVMVIGIDSMDSELLSKYIDDLPNFKKLKESAPNIKLESVFPPDSDTAWASIYTGLNPAQHGVVKFVDPIEKSADIHTKESEADYIQGKTFWDIASKVGKKVIVLLPHIAYPPWEVNGVMVSRSRIEDKVESYPHDFDYDLQKLNSPKGVPKKDGKSLKKFLDSYRKLVLEEKKFFLKMIKKDWDLFFCYSSSLDAIQHYFWNFCDEESPDFIKDNSFEDVIKDFYVLYDDMVGELIDASGKEVISIVLSDHGHQGRPKKLANINELLRQYGFLNSSDMDAVSSSIEDLKSKSIEWVSKYNIGWIASKILKIFPQFINFYVKNRSIDLKSSKAYVTDLSGIKAYTYGGIKIKKSKNYEQTRNDVIKLIKGKLDDIIVFIAKREEIYTGDYASKYPDILIQLKDGYGLGNKINVPIISEAHSSSIVPGSHNKDTAILFINGYESNEISVSLEDIISLVTKFIEDNPSYNK